jgi:hypothetical protein
MASPGRHLGAPRLASKEKPTANTRHPWRAAAEVRAQLRRKRRLLIARVHRAMVEATED